MGGGGNADNILIFSRNLQNNKIEVLSTFNLPKKINDSSSGIAVSPDGQYVYATNISTGDFYVMARDTISGGLSIIETINRTGLVTMIVSPFDKQVYLYHYFYGGHFLRFTRGHRDSGLTLLNDWSFDLPFRPPMPPLQVFAYLP